MEAFVRLGHVFNDAFEYRGIIGQSKQIRFWPSVSGNSNSKLYKSSAVDLPHLMSR